MSISVLCYGDSNTYGYNPTDGLRYPENVRWTGKLSHLLGSDYRVIEEGCNGRTTVFDDPFEVWKNGLDYLKPCLYSHKPVDIVIMMLGTNDLKESFHATAEDIANGVETLVKEIVDFTKEKQEFVPKIILVSPAYVGDDLRTSPFYGDFLESAIDRSKQFAAHYKKVAEKYGCTFVDAAEYVEPSPLDSIHLTAEGHIKLAEALFEVIK